MSCQRRLTAVDEDAQLDILPFRRLATENAASVSPMQNVPVSGRISKPSSLPLANSRKPKLLRSAAALSMEMHTSNDLGRQAHQDGGG
jgi:hypothetical protein